MTAGMARPQGPDSATTTELPDDVSETLSQFSARVLDQLSLSAWLPSASLVLSLTFIFQLGVALESRTGSKGLGYAIGRAFDQMAKASLGGALLLVAAVVVLTIITQAFTFEAIRVLEGYWGTCAVVERMARSRCKHFRCLAVRLKQQDDDLTRQAWDVAMKEILDRRKKAEQLNANWDEREWTPEMIEYLNASLTGEPYSGNLDVKDQMRALAIPWETYSDQDILRRQINIDKRLRDFPQPSRVLPTLLGNVLRAYEDQVERQPLETFVLDIYDELPVTLRSQHNNQRNKLDLYCSMTFVMALVGLICATRLGVIDPLYAAFSVLFWYSCAWLMYRAAITSARAYGLLLVSIDKKFPAAEAELAPANTRPSLPQILARLIKRRT
jgi:hypothetical protein